MAKQSLSIQVHSRTIRISNSTSQQPMQSQLFHALIEQHAIGDIEKSLIQLINIELIPGPNLYI